MSNIWHDVVINGRHYRALVRVMDKGTKVGMVTREKPSGVMVGEEADLRMEFEDTVIEGHFHLGVVMEGSWTVMQWMLL